MAELEFDAATGAVSFKDRIVGEYDDQEKVLNLNAGWCRLAGLGLRVEGDRSDRRRVLLERIGDEKTSSRQEIRGQEELPTSDPVPTV